MSDGAWSCAHSRDDCECSTGDGRDRNDTSTPVPNDGIVGPEAPKEVPTRTQRNNARKRQRDADAEKKPNPRVSVQHNIIKASGSTPNLKLKFKDVPHTKTGYTCSHHNQYPDRVRPDRAVKRTGTYSERRRRELEEMDYSLLPRDGPQ